MQKYLYLIILSFFVTSCYTYQRKKQVTLPPETGQDSKKKAVDEKIASAQLSNAPTEVQNMNSKVVNQQQLVPINIQNELQPTKNYKIKVDNRSYKIIVDKWEGDTLVAHQLHRPEAILKFNKNQINAESIAEKRFSKPLSDIITILVYGGIGVGIYMLLR